MKKKYVILIVVVLALALVGYFVFPGLVLKVSINTSRKAAGLEQKTVKVGDHDIVYLEGGSGETVLMVHGFASNKDFWTSFAQFITPAYHVIALDVPGFGESTYLENASYKITDQVERLNQFVDALGLQKFHIVGNSMGGVIAAKYAILFPDRVITLGLFDSGGVSSPEQRELMSSAEPSPLFFETVEGFDRMLYYVFSKPPDIPLFIKKLFVRNAQKSINVNRRISGQLESQKVSLEPDLQKIKMHTLVLWGDQDRLIDVSCVQVFQNGLPNCTAVIMKDCGHVPMVERPQETAEHYLTFLKSK